MSAPAIPTKKAAGFLFSYVKKHLPSVVLGMLLLVLVDLFQLLIPRLIRRTVDILGEESFARQTIISNSLKIVALAVAMVVVRFFWRLCIMRPSRRIETQMRQDMFGRLLQLSFSFFNRTKTGDLMALFINDMNAVRMATGPALIGLTDAAFMGTMSIVFMMSISVPLTLLTIIPLPLIIVLMLRFGGIIQSRFAEVQEVFGDISSHTQESFSGIRVIKGFAQEEREVEGFVRLCDVYVDKNVRLVRLWGIFFPLITFLASLSLSLLFYFGSRSVIAGSITLGQFVSFTFYIGLLVWPMMAVGWVFNMFQRGIASAKRIMGLLESTPDVTVRALPERAGAAAMVTGPIEINDLSFRYAPQGRDVLRHISLCVPAGGSLGIMGKPGSGKTTLISLLFHLFPLPRGAVRIGGADINDISVDKLRKSIGYVPQDSFLFSDSIAANIAFGIDEGAADNDGPVRVSRLAALHDEIMGFPDGYATRIGERGVTLSGGQKQRLAIARALLMSPSILIFDDALSSVDAATERAILSALQSEIRGRTSLIVAHRISTVMRCDSIIVLSDGEIVEQGTHEQLCALDGFYSRLYHLQRLRERAA
jgi:ATP-binding cassette, subfamily B, multidrug efflux pump